jgi:HEAT repeat protein
MLRQLASSRSDLRLADVEQDVVSALSDPRPEVRRQALSAIAARAGTVRFSSTDSLRAQGEHDRPVLRSLLPQVAECLDDPDADVRRAAILAAVNIEFNVSGSTRLIALSTPVMEKLLSRYAVETAPPVRTELLKTFALTASLGRPVEAILESALGESSPSVLQPAIMGVARLRLQRALPRLVELLAHASAAVRMGAAQAVAGFGRAAVSSLPALRQALNQEQDPVVRQTLQGAIEAVAGDTSN